MPSTTPDFSTVTGGGSSVRGTDGGRSAPGAPSGYAAAAEIRRASIVPFSARHRRRKAVRPARAAAVRPADWGEDPATADPAELARWSASAYVRALSAT